MDNLSRKEKEKLLREEDIINAAEKVFVLKGYSGTSMEEIAKEAQFTRKTVYQYFADKDDLFFSVIIRGFQRMLNYFEEDITNGKNGFEKLHSLGSAYYRFYQDYPETLELMNYVGYINPKEENSAKLQEFNKVTTAVVRKIAEIIDEGKADGSIRKDLDSMKAAFSIEFLTTGFFHMLSVSGKTFLNHFSLNKEDFINYNMDLLTDAIREKNIGKD